MTRTAIILCAAALVAAGCDEFDPALYMRAEADAGAGIDAGFVLSDTCTEVPMLSSSPDNVHMVTTALTDDVRAVAACTGQNAPGNDGFFGVEMHTGEKWHFHVRSATSGRNPSIYVLGSACDVRTCGRGDAIDRCDTDSDEHLSFLAPSDGVFRIGLDDRNAGGGEYDVLALHPTCGSGGMPEHSESCDDGNLDDGDGCDSECRKELSAAFGTDEKEPNDDPTGANVVTVGAGASLSVAGSIGGRCDIDLYVIDVPAGASLAVTMLDRSATACPDGTATIDMVMWEPGGHTALGDGSIRTGNACPVIDDMHAFAQGLAAGEYLVSVTMAEDERPFDYRLRFDLSM